MRIPDGLLKSIPAASFSYANIISACRLPEETIASNIIELTSRNRMFIGIPNVHKTCRDKNFIINRLLSLEKEEISNFTNLNNIKNKWNRL